MKRLAVMILLVMNMFCFGSCSREVSADTQNDVDISGRTKFYDLSGNQAIVFIDEKLGIDADLSEYGIEDREITRQLIRDSEDLEETYKLYRVKSGYEEIFVLVDADNEELINTVEKLKNN